MPRYSRSSVTGRVDVLDRELAGELVVAVARGHDLGRAEGDGGVVLDVEEVGGEQVLVASGFAAVHRRHVDRRLDRGVERILGDGDGAAGYGEPAADLGDHQVAGRERHVGVGRVECPRAGGGKGGCLGDLYCCHGMLQVA